MRLNGEFKLNSNSKKCGEIKGTWVVGVKSNLIGWRTAWGHGALDGLATIEGGVAWQAAFFFAAGDSPLTEKYGPRRRRTEKNTYFIRKLYRDTVQMLVVYLSPCRSFAIGC